MAIFVRIIHLSIIYLIQSIFELDLGNQGTKTLVAFLYFSYKATLSLFQFYIILVSVNTVTCAKTNELKKVPNKPK